jgi:DNA-binding transcriptional ArsR family regulator
MSDLDARMRALRSRTRREILARIWDRDLPAGEIAAAFDLTAATISEHLAILRRAGLVEMTKVGTSRRYRARPAALAGLHGALEDAAKWRPVDDIPERALTKTATAPAVVVEVGVTTSPKETFRALTDGEVYSRWLEVPVTIEGDRFAATLEWGTEVRGRYELVVPPHLIVMGWDFDDGNVPVPGHPLTGYLRIHPDGDGSRVVVHQLVDRADQAEFMTGAWAMVLGRLKANVVAALAGSALPQRPPRGKEGVTPRPPAVTSPIALRAHCSHIEPSAEGWKSE